jgi:hypothetical protein
MTTHLHPNIAPLLTLSNRERRDAIEATKWIPYTRSQEVITQMRNMVRKVASHRPQNMLIVGVTNNGKTSILRKFVDEHAPAPRNSDGRLIWPVFYVQAPAEPDEKRFYNGILERACVPYRLADTASKKQQQVIHILKHMEVKVLVIDEIHNILAGSQSKQRVFLNVIRHLCNELMIPFVCAGIETAANAMHYDAQLSNRFEPEVLPNWGMNDEYLRLLLSFEQLLPIKEESVLTEEAIAYKLLSMSEGTIGELSNLLKLAAVTAIENKTERITLSLLSKLKYTVPSERMKVAKHLKPKP